MSILHTGHGLRPLKKDSLSVDFSTISPWVINTIFWGWRSLILLIAVGHIAVGVFILIGDTRGIPAVGALTYIGAVPYQIWGISAVIFGLLIMCRPVAQFGMLCTSLWYVVWSTCLIVGVIKFDGPLYALPIYMLLTAIHLLVLVVDFVASRLVRRAP